MRCPDTAVFRLSPPLVARQLTTLGHSQWLEPPGFADANGPLALAVPALELPYAASRMPGARRSWQDPKQTGLRACRSYPLWFAHVRAGNTASALRREQRYPHPRSFFLNSRTRKNVWERSLLGGHMWRICGVWPPRGTRTTRHDSRRSAVHGGRRFTAVGGLWRRRRRRCGAGGRRGGGGAVAL